MDVAAYLDRLEDEGAALATAAGHSGWDARVPGTDWQVRDLVTHVGGVHRWAADVVASCADNVDTPAYAAVGSGPSDDELLAWFVAGHRALVHTLRAAPSDLDCAAFLPASSPLAFWARRQAHETAIHRADAVAACGDDASFPADFAQDGIAELLLGFAARKRKPLDAAVLMLRATDGPGWRIELGEHGVSAAPLDEDAAAAAGADPAATVTGSSSELYLWLWNRLSRATVSGDAGVAGRWASTVRVRW